MKWALKIRFYVLMITILLILLISVISWSDLPFQSIFGGAEKASPSNWISQDQIKVYPQFVVLDLPNAVWASFTNTNSMDPVLDEQSNALEIKPGSALEIKVGDVISYQTDQGIIVHRVIEEGQDTLGNYFIVKGDNATLADPVKVRFDQVQGVVVAVLY